MVKATVNFDDELYRKLIRETVDMYGKMRGFSDSIILNTVLSHDKSWFGRTYVIFTTLDYSPYSS